MPIDHDAAITITFRPSLQAYVAVGRHYLQTKRAQVVVAVVIALMPVALAMLLGMTDARTLIGILAICVGAPAFVLALGVGLGILFGRSRVLVFHREGIRVIHGARVDTHPWSIVSEHDITDAAIKLRTGPALQSFQLTRADPRSPFRWLVIPARSCAPEEYGRLSALVKERAAGSAT